MVFFSIPNFKSSIFHTHQNKKKRQINSLKSKKMSNLYLQIKLAPRHDSAGRTNATTAISRQVSRTIWFDVILILSILQLFSLRFEFCWRLDFPHWTYWLCAFEMRWESKIKCDHQQHWVSFQFQPNCTRQTELFQLLIYFFCSNHFDRIDYARVVCVCRLMKKPIFTISDVVSNFLIFNPFRCWSQNCCDAGFPNSIWMHKIITKINFSFI